VLVEEGADEVVEVDLTLVVEVPAASPGRHWLYQSFWYTHL
jgi:hypothetical protein